MLTDTLVSMIGDMADLFYLPDAAPVSGFHSACSMTIINSILLAMASRRWL